MKLASLDLPENSADQDPAELSPRICEKARLLTNPDISYRPANGCSADLQSAVSRICNPPPVRHSDSPADWKSAIQQVENLRYDDAAHVSLFKAYEMFGLTSLRVEAGSRLR